LGVPYRVIDNQKYTRMLVIALHPEERKKFDEKIHDYDLASLTFWTETNSESLETQIKLLKEQLDSFEVCSKLKANR
jgi:hypothetical protein